MNQAEVHKIDATEAGKKEQQGRQIKRLGLILGTLSFLAVVILHRSALPILLHLPEFGNEKAAILWGNAFLEIGFGVLLFLMFSVTGFYISASLESRKSKQPVSK